MWPYVGGAGLVGASLDQFVTTWRSAHRHRYENGIHCLHLSVDKDFKYTQDSWKGLEWCLKCVCVCVCVCVWRTYVASLLLVYSTTPRSFHNHDNEALAFHARKQIIFLERNKGFHARETHQQTHTPTNTHTRTYWLSLFRSLSLK